MAAFNYRQNDKGIVPFTIIMWLVLTGINAFIVIMGSANELGRLILFCGLFFGVVASLTIVLYLLHIRNHRLELTESAIRLYNLFGKLAKEIAFSEVKRVQVTLRSGKPPNELFDVTVEGDQKEIRFTSAISDYENLMDTLQRECPQAVSE